MELALRIETSIIGTGALGSTLARALIDKGFRLKSLFNRTGERAVSLADVLGVTVKGVFPEGREELGRVVILAVPDREIAGVTKLLSMHIDDMSGMVVAHCSGNETSALLDPIRDKGGLGAAFQPLQTFHRTSLPEAFEGIYFTLEGDESAVELLAQVATALGGIPFPVNAEAKPYLHVAAVVVCNYMMALIGMAQEITRLGGLEAGKVQKALLPLMKTTLENSSTDDIAKVLSGPVARGDSETVGNHLKILEQDNDLLDLYKKLGSYLLKHSRNLAGAPGEELDRIKELLT